MPGWFEPKLLFLSFSPSSNPFKNRFLKCLDYSPQAIPIERLLNRAYALEHSLQMQWDSLEQTLRIFLKACHLLSPAVFDAGFHFWVYPRQFGYSAAWQREEIARKVTINSHSAFIPLLAAVSFMLHVLHYYESSFNASLNIPFKPILESSFLSLCQNQVIQWRNEPVSCEWNLWERLQVKTSIGSEFLDYLNETIQIPPVGVFINVRNSDTPTLLPIFLKNTDLLVALYLGNVDNWSYQSISQYRLPFPDEVLVRELKNAQRPYNPPNLFSLPPPSPLSQSSFPPKPPLHIPQISGGIQPPLNEAMESFFNRRAQAQEHAIASESMKDRQSHLDHE
ncbi:hypothetical protein GYMLUDRAFT_252657 [Collybiopsis luxurians FD-317 M1]|uniref:Uncharacterized protein n=1 Tax=Collybiopsis luxurians FD-317 M1 TaxID=944289 RepID=A0A0D0BZJ9_9AGAR|nr:hypothetical protein GYMLUDRAFT_252657 [Collybiopsis luxurians FD-317 M1]